MGLLVQRGNVHISHAIIGRSDLDQSGKVSAKIQTALIGNMLYNMLRTGSIPKWAEQFARKKMGDDVTEKILNVIGGMSDCAKNVSKISMKNQFYSDLVTPLADHISAAGTTVHILTSMLTKTVSPRTSTRA